FSLRVDSINHDSNWVSYRMAVNAGQDVCGAAMSSMPPPPAGVKDMCSTGQMFEILQYVGYGVGVGLAAIGVFVGASHGSRTEQAPSSGRLRIQPLVGPSTAGLVAVGRF